MRTTMDLIIPARNEEANVPALAEALRPLVASGVVRRVVLVDNGSTDRTAQLAEKAGFIVVQEHFPGYGSACLAGLRCLVLFHENSDPRPGVVGFLDADLADDPAQLVGLLSHAEQGAELVIGSRRKLRKPGSMTFTQRFGNGLACVLIRLATGQRYTDLGPMRLVRWDALQRLDMRDTTWGWTVEMQFKAATLGLRIVEVDVPYRRRHAGKSQISGTLLGSYRAGKKILLTIAVLWWRGK